MRHSPLLVLAVTLATFNVSAQITSVKVHAPELDKSGHWQEVVENLDSRAIVAMHASFDCPTRFPMKSGRYATFPKAGEYDVLGNPPDIFVDHKGIPLGGTAVITAADPVKCRGGVDTIVFSNGQIEGSSHRVNDFHELWGGIDEGIIESLPLLAKVANQEANLAEVESVLRHLMESIPYHPLRKDGTFDSKRWGERAVYSQLDSLLRGAREVKAASDPTRQPQTEAIEVNGIPRKQSRKMAIDLINKLQDWKTALENGLEAPDAE
jgi:hypothetical protein